MCRPDWGPGFSLVPFENASRTAFVVVGVRSSCERRERSLTPSRTKARAYIEIVVYNYHWRITTGTLALNLDHSELAILRRFARLNSAQVAAYRFEDFGRASEHTRCRCAHLHEILANRFAEHSSRISWQGSRSLGQNHVPVEHGVERRDFVHTHGWHLHQLRHIIHNAYARPSLVLPLAEIEKGDDSCLLVLRRIVRDDFISAFKILRCELERDLEEGVR